MAAITLKVNGTTHTIELEHDRVRLAEILREQLGLTGTKVGCGVGKCGSCTVLVNGEPVTSCTLLARKADGAEILTIEGMADGAVLHPIQEAFLDAGAVQCGFCTPGLILRTYSLLRAHPTADDGQIVEMLRHHLCRCTGYEAILAAVKLSRERMQSA